jgi:hypothetical protein
MITLLNDDAEGRIVKYTELEEREAAIALLRKADPLKVYEITLDLLPVWLPSDIFKQTGYVGYRKIVDLGERPPQRDYDE